MDLNGKVAIITGGAMGNGLGIAEVFLKLGATVVILDYSDKLGTTLGQLMKISQNVIGYKVDITDKNLVNQIVDAVYKKYNKIDILVNNAGVAKLVKFEDMTDDIRDFHIDINIKGTWNVTKAVYPYMVKNNYGKIVNLSSVTGPKVADPGEVAYATTKAALIGFTKGLAMEGVKHNITVNAILPGYIMTPMVEGIAKDSDSNNPENVIKGIADGIPMGRLGTIQELGNLAAFLASDLSNYITGSEFVIDGASTLPETKSVGVYNF